MKKILITGGAGYIGSHTVRFLLQHGFNPEEIVVFDKASVEKRHVLPKEVLFHQGDLRKREDIEAVFSTYDIGSVIHFASLINVEESFRDPRLYFENNIIGGLNLLEAMVKFNCKKIIFSSSCAVYGESANIPITENEPCNPINPYGESKLVFERFLGWYFKIHHVSSVRLRYFNVAGASFGIGENHDPETHLIPLVFKAAYEKNGEIRILGTDYPTADGTCVRDYVHILDLADAHSKALLWLDQQIVPVTDVFNIGSGKGTSVQQIVDAVKVITKRDFKVTREDRRQGDPPVLTADYAKAQRVLAWMPTKRLSDIIRDSATWHKKQYE